MPFVFGDYPGLQDAWDAYFRADSEHRIQEVLDHELWELTTPLFAHWTSEVLPRLSRDLADAYPDVRLAFFRWNALGMFATLRGQQGLAQLLYERLVSEVRTLPAEPPVSNGLAFHQLGWARLMHMPPLLEDALPYFELAALEDYRLSGDSASDTPAFTILKTVYNVDPATVRQRGEASVSAAPPDQRDFLRAHPELLLMQAREVQLEDLDAGVEVDRDANDL
jgi:hypothetical protein